MRRPLREKEKHTPRPDHRYGSERVSMFINYVMKRGKKTVAERVVYDAFDAVAEATKEKPLEIFEAAVRNVGPSMEVRSRRVGGANYQVPYEVRPERRLALSMRWILSAARAKKGKSMAHRLAGELIAASKEEGEAIKKKATMHSMAEANKAFAHFAFNRPRRKTR
jgi:small subunit ribosomal protein S7